MSKNNYTDRKKLGDYPYCCQICSAKAWYSETTKLAPDTGKGGLRVCPDCVSITDYGIVPYTIRPEKSVTDVNNPLTSTYNARPPIDTNTFDPLSGNNS